MRGALRVPAGFPVRFSLTPPEFMCAIGGILDPSLANQAALIPSLQRMAHAMQHRGPDEEGAFIEPGIGMIHRRLSIVGVGNGRQPLSNEDGSVITVCNGEFFDHVEQRAWLERRGHVLSTDSDCEILAHLYEEFGEGMVHHLRGQFAFALWDKRRRILLLARDRVGIAPLHWARAGRSLVFASEIKGILASGLVAPELDPRGLDHIFTFLAQPGRRTCFAGIRFLLPGTMLRVSFPRDGDLSFHEHRYWDLDFPDRGHEYDPGEARIVEEFGQHFEEAVRLRLRADVPVVTYLSGGVDSTSVLSVASRIRQEPLPAFSIRIPTPGLDEMNEARAAADTVGARPFQITCDDQVVGRSFPDLVEAADAPVIDTAAAALLNLSRTVRDHGYKVALTGEGADEALAGYPWLKVGRILGCLDRGEFRPGNAVRYLALKAFRPGRTWEDANRYQHYIGGPQGISDLYGMYGDARFRFFSPSLWNRLDGHIAYEDLDLNLTAMKRWDPLNQALYFGYKTLLPGMLLSHKGDRIAMRHSVETRYPFLDEGVVDFCSSVHPRWKLRGCFRDKRLLRTYASGFLPASIWNRPKQIFRAPFAATFFANPPEFADQLLSEESLARTGLFDTRAVRDTRDAYVRGEVRGVRRVFTEMGLTAVMATQLWHHKYLGGGLCDLPVWGGRSAAPRSNDPPSVVPMMAGARRA